MSQITLFRIAGGKAAELPSSASDLEKPLQTLIEDNLDALLGIRFLATEYSTGKTHAGRIDTLGVDENDCPVILEYKRSAGENVINQGLFYLDWLMDHQAEFKLLVLERYGKESAEAIDWSAPRLICIASDFTRYDGHAVQQINRNIELIRYKLFGDELLLFELVNGASATSLQGVEASEETVPNSKPMKTPAASTLAMKTHADQIATASPELTLLFDQTRSHILAQGDDIIEKPLKLYVAFRRLKNFVCMSLISKQDPHVFLTLKLDPATVELQPGFSRDVSKIGHWGTGDLEVILRTPADLERAKVLIERAYQEN